MNHKPQSGRRQTVPALPSSIPFSDEIEYLAMIKEKLDAAVEGANENVKKIDKEYMDAKRYMADYRGEIDPHEMFQNELALKQIDRNGAFAVGIWEKLAKLKDSPYFARIDFQTNGYGEAIKHYIGRFAFTHAHQILIVDWRAPIASMFYDYEIGSAGYEAPVGRIEGNLTRKRQLKIKNGILEYVIESSVNIQDDVLQRELSQTSDEKMKSIIATIQKEQNQIIRNDKVKTMIIQGVAGSGKTSIALHRIAFLLYRFRNRLSASNITILSPNKVFGDYIANVLPELGEEPICELSFWDIADAQLQGMIQFEPEKDPIETNDAQWAERVSYKSTLHFVRKLDEFIEALPKLIFEPTDYTIGQYSVTAEWIQKRFLAYQSYSIKKRVELIANDIHDHFQSIHFMEDEIPRAKVILKNLSTMLKIKNTLALYKFFYQWLGLSHLLILPKKQTLEWSDVFPFLYLHRAFQGLKKPPLMKHLVIDEMQDYTPIQYAVLNQLYTCEKTILGDFSQSIHPNHLHTLAQLQELYNDAYLVELNKSYRSTYEIIAFAKSIGQVEKLEPIERHGDVPMIVSCLNRNEELEQIKAKLDSFLKSGAVSLGIILKTNSAAKEIYELLKHDYDIQHISMDSTHFGNGISVASVQMSKGLEFDEVIIPNVNEDVYCSNYDRGLLYVACTRAMHKLTLLYSKKPSHFLFSHLKESSDIN